MNDRFLWQRRNCFFSAFWTIANFFSPRFISLTKWFLWAWIIVFFYLQKLLDFLYDIFQSCHRVSTCFISSGGKIHHFGKIIIRLIIFGKIFCAFRIFSVSYKLLVPVAVDFFSAVSCLFLSLLMILALIIGRFPLVFKGSKRFTTELITHLRFFPLRSAFPLSHHFSPMFLKSFIQRFLILSHTATQLRSKLLSQVEGQLGYPRVSEGQHVGLELVHVDLIHNERKDRQWRLWIVPSLKKSGSVGFSILQ